MQRTFSCGSASISASALAQRKDALRMRPAVDRSLVEVRHRAGRTDGTVGQVRLGEARLQGPGAPGAAGGGGGAPLRSMTSISRDGSVFR